MTYFVQHVRVVDELCRELVAAGFSPFIGARSADLAPLHDGLDIRVGVLTVPRDDNAIGIAAGVSLAGGFPVVLLPDSGPGATADVIASVIAPHEVPMLLVIALGAAATNPAMIRLSEQVLDEFGIESVWLDPEARLADRIGDARAIVQEQLRPAALLVPAAAFGGRAA